MMHTTANGRTATCCAKQSRLEETLASIAEEGHGAIETRLARLDREWSVGQMAKATTGALILAGLALTMYVNPWFALVPALAGLALLQYLMFRRNLLTDLFAGLGYRFGVDIEHERIALKALRGDFRHLPTLAEIEDRDAISRFEGEGGPVYEAGHRVAPREAVREVVEATRL